MMTREEAIALLNEQYETCKRIYDCSADQRKSYPNVPQFMEALGMALSALRPVSREKAILCKDCQYWQGNNGGYPHPECRWGNDETPDEDDYCSFAERLEVSKNG